MGTASKGRLPKTEKAQQLPRDRESGGLADGFEVWCSGSFGCGRLFQRHRIDEGTRPKVWM